MFGDNQSVVTSGTIPHSTLNKRHNALAYHRVREAVAADILNFMHISTKQNVADALTKFLPYPVWRPLIEPLLFRKGDTMTQKDAEELYAEEKIGISETTSVKYMSVMEEMNAEQECETGVD